MKKQNKIYLNENEHDLYKEWKMKKGWNVEEEWKSRRENI